MPPQRTTHKKPSHTSPWTKAPHITITSSPSSSVSSLSVADDPINEQTPGPTPDSDRSDEKTTARGSLSWIWNHGYRVGATDWHCNRQGCKKTLSSASTTHVLSHMKQHHGMTDTERGEPSAPQDSLQLAEIFKRVSPFDRHMMEKNLVEWMLRDRIPFSQVESRPFANSLHLFATMLSALSLDLEIPFDRGYWPDSIKRVMKSKNTSLWLCRISTFHATCGPPPTITPFSASSRIGQIQTIARGPRSSECHVSQVLTRASTLRALWQMYCNCTISDKDSDT